MSTPAEHLDDDDWDPGRLIRYAETLSATLMELRSIPAGSLTPGQLRPVIEQALRDAGDAIPASLLPEFHRLVAPALDDETERDLRVLLAELQGWVLGLLASIGVTFSDARSGEPPD